MEDKLMNEQERKYAIVIKKERIEVTEEVYKSYYKLMERERHLDKLAEKKHISIEACHEKGVQVEYIISRTEETLEDNFIKQEMLDMLVRCLKMLPEQEQLLIKYLFFDGISERSLALMMDLPQKTLNNRKLKLLQKLKNLLES
jgi:DNA-directed RNA polymerase specialized sigma24 family protein